MTPERLLVVADASAARGGGTLLLPKLVLPVGAPRSVEVELRAPDGSCRAVTAVFEVPHVRGALPPYAALRLLAVTAGEVDVGTEVWWSAPVAAER